MSHGATTETHCLNCSAALRGPWCHACGQKSGAAHLDVHHVAHEAVHEFLHLDGKILRTVKLLVLQPGQLTKEFIEGRRARSISPLRLYLTFSVLFFAITAIVPGARDVFFKSNVKTATSQERVEAEKTADRLAESVVHNLPRTMFVLMPVFALLTWAFFHRQQRYYVPHLYYSIHFHAFLFLIMAVTVLFGIGGTVSKAIGQVVFLTSFPYHFLALRRVFGGSWGKVLLKGTAIGVAYLLIIAGALIAIVTLMIRSL